MTHTTVGERLSFGLGLLGQNIIYGISVGFMMYAFTDIIGLAPATVGVLFLVARSWDALNDPVMGVLADRTRTRWGRFRPWLLWTPLPIALFTALAFVNPGLTGRAAVAYAAVVYVMWGMLYTLNDIPFWALTSAMTPDSTERTRIITAGRALSMIGLGIPTVALPALAERLVRGGTSVSVHGVATTGDVPNVSDVGTGEAGAAGLNGVDTVVDALPGAALNAGYLPAVLLLLAVAVPLMTMAFFGTRERVSVPSSPVGFHALRRMLLANRPLQIIVLAGLLNSFTFVAQSMVVYFVTHNLGDPGLMVWFGGTGVLSLAMGVVVTPLFSERFGKRRVMIVTSFVRAAVGLLLYWSGYTYLPLAVGLYALLVGLMGPAVVLQTAMIADAVDYGERRTGVRSEAVTFSFQTFLSKANAAVGGLVGGILLERVGYEAGLIQSVATLRGIYAILTLTPAVAGIMSAIPFFWYPLRRS